MRVLVVQIRVDSRRLPGKALLPLADKPVCSHVFSTLKKIEAHRYVLATTEDSRPYLEEPAAHGGFEVVTGPKYDVYSRFLSAIGTPSPDIVIRATGDNSILGLSLFERQIAAVESGEYDYAGYRNIPVGTGIEVFTAHSLLSCREYAMTDFDREHVTPFIYNNPDIFRVKWMAPPERFHRPDLRYTLDTREDYVRLNDIYRLYYRGEPLSLTTILDKQ